MIATICAGPGFGKSALAAALGVGNMVGDEAAEAVSDSEYLLKDLKFSGFPKFEVPKDHLLYSDFAIHAKINGSVVAKSKDIDGFKVGLYVKGYDTVLLPPRSTIILDEAQIYYDSKRGTRLPDFVSRLYAMHRHNYYTFYLISQRPVAIDKSIRSLCEKFIFIIKMRNYPDMFGNLAMTVWECVEFNNTESAESYSNNKIIDANGTIKRYVYEGNIFECYDSHGKFSLFYDGRENAEFANSESKFINWNGEEIRTYNAAHKIETPEIFLKQKRKSKDELEDAA